MNSALKELLVVGAVLNVMQKVARPPNLITAAVKNGFITVTVEFSFAPVDAENLFSDCLPGRFPPMDIDEDDGSLDGLELAAAARDDFMGAA